MSFLVPMSKPFFAPYIEELIVQYAKENVEAGRWQRSGSLSRARRDIERLLPCGIDTENHHFFEMKVPEVNETVGMVWLSLENSATTSTVFIYDLEVKAEHRRKGYAKLALREIEDFAATHNIVNIGLHVFSNNAAAQKLYNEMGYETVSINMVKKISQADV
ncbi:GNAT family N-acetyltransferase [Marinomonas spartinae]|uniref:GNAT family N-acetyltransferase n=1 Tax=Marinomonas spartinae TaxID=1792290 RepID=UPI0018F1D77F|nr:GNAT family N-acetyltransferase [Marinomonas spartinae]MBJ7555483.1 GNAT family N-acetyltransferase [Marinomonas spartinae]